MEPPADELERGTELRQGLVPTRGERRELEQRGQIVGKLVLRKRQAGLGESPLQPHELQPALPPVAVGVIREIETRAPVEVEGGHVLVLQMAQRERAQRFDERRDAPVVRGLEQLVAGCDERPVRVLEQHREEPEVVHAPNRPSFDSGTNPVPPVCCGGCLRGCGKPPPPCASTSGPATSACPFGIT